MEGHILLTMHEAQDIGVELLVLDRGEELIDHGAHRVQRRRDLIGGAA